MQLGRIAGVALGLWGIAGAAACGASNPPAPVPPLTTAPLTAVAPPAPPPMDFAKTGLVAEWMDPAADACQDFYAYACGGFEKTATIPSDRSAWGAIQILDKQTEDFLHDTLEKAAASPGDDPVLKKLGDYYAACVDEAAIDKAGAKPIQPLLDVVATVRDDKTLTAALSKLHAATVFPIFDVSQQQDFKDATQVIAFLDQAGLGLPDRDYYLKDDGNLKSVREYYAGHVGRMLALLGLKGAELKAAADDVMRIETKLARIAQDKVTRRDPYKVYHRVDRAGLPGLAKSMPWDAYFSELGIPGTQAISVNDPAYFSGVEALLHEEKPAAWRHYLAWQVAHHQARTLSKPFVDEAFALRQKLTGQKELEPRWKRCVRSTDAALGELLAQPYVAAKFAGDSRERARALVAAIDDAMGADIQGLSWMDDATKQAALAKLAKLGASKVGYPEKWRVYDFDVARASYAKNAMAATRFEQRRELAKIGKPVDRTDWEMTPPTVNAYYTASLNEIVLPAGQLQPPFFSRDFYPPVNMGDTGAGTIGHEITHGFDDEGSQFDGDGNLRVWWSDATRAHFDAATKCVQDQYSGYDAVPGVKLNGALTSGENIADIGGLKLGLAALHAWQKTHPDERRSVPGLDDEQVFFVAYAQSWCMKQTPEAEELGVHSDPHSPPRWRVNGPVSDTPAFSQAFQCKQGTPMAPANVCAVW
jgi:putative endopeptidase